MRIARNVTGILHHTNWVVILQEDQPSFGIMSGVNGIVCLVAKCGCERKDPNESTACQRKPAASVAVCRRGGSTAVYQCMNMPFEMLNCPVVTSQYWNVVFGRGEGECEKDTEGMQTMRTLDRNMAWLIKNLKRGDAVPRSADEPWQPMHFIR